MEQNKFDFGWMNWAEWFLPSTYKIRDKQRKEPVINESPANKNRIALVQLLNNLMGYLGSRLGLDYRYIE